MPINEVETHPYLYNQVLNFNDEVLLSKYTKLIVGTFPIYRLTDSTPTEPIGLNMRANWNQAAFIQFFYGSNGSHFWTLFSSAFNEDIPNTEEEAIAMLENNEFMISDVFQSSERNNYSPLDSDLVNSNNNESLVNIIQNSINLNIIYFTSKTAKEKFAEILGIHYVNSNDSIEIIFENAYRMIVLISPAGNGRTVRHFFNDFPLNQNELALINNNQRYALGYRQRYYTHYLNIPANV